MSRATHSVGLCLALVGLGCGDQGGHVELVNMHGDRDGGSEGGAVDGGKDGGATGVTPMTDAGQDAAPVDCTNPVPPSSPLRRLTRFEYNNTVRDLFGDKSHPGDALPPESFVAPGDALDISETQVTSYHAIAHNFAEKTAGDAIALGALLGCDPAATGEPACRRTFIEGLISRMFRRPATPDDVAEFETVFTNGQTLGGNFASGARAVLEVALQSPEFLYRVEMGESAADRGPEWARPAPYEMATRLSYLLWGSTPDAALFAAAAQGKLRTPEDITTQARRLLADDRSHDVVRYFYFQLLGLGGELPERDRVQFPTYTPEIAQFALQETQAFIDDVTWKGAGDFASVFNTHATWVNGPLAKFYGIGNVTGDTFQKVNLDPTQRGGLFTQGSFLAATSPGSTNPVQRGYRIANLFLCAKIPNESAVDPLIPPPQPPPVGAETTRQKFARHTADATCATCHRQIDPIGFALEHFDAVGLWRDTENGLAIDATGEVPDSILAGRFDGAVELSNKIAESAGAQACFVSNWAAYAYGRPQSTSDACTNTPLMKSFTEARFNVPALLVALTQTDAFLYRATRPAQ